ncbi:hypothetical protein [Weissella cibaria]|uniref:hypothetical protein n=1 Tax=Weissella cibaria TaxID=137591 RepID=UPI0013DAE45F|nr:hypothetical protein [Weissella cibaria]NFA03127.1 hypothetical protein [Weissella cibaria]
MFGKKKTSVAQPANTKHAFYQQLAYHTKRAWDMAIVLAQLDTLPTDATQRHSLHVDVSQPDGRRGEGLTSVSFYVDPEEMRPVFVAKRDEQASIAAEYLESLLLSPDLTTRDRDLVATLRDMQQNQAYDLILKTLLNHNVITRRDIN